MGKKQKGETRDKVVSQRDAKVGSLKLSELQKLPHFYIRDKFRHDEHVYLEGEFKPRFDPTESSGRLYVLSAKLVKPDAIFSILWSTPDETSSIVEYYSNWDCEEIAVGKSWPCGTWDLFQLLLILDLDIKWETRTFHPSDSWAYESSPGWRSRLSPGARPPKGAKDVKKMKKGWDHEHCAFCWATISEYAERVGYVGKDAYGNEQWVCRACYESKIVPHKL